MNSAVNCLKFIDENVLAAGMQDGKLIILNVPELKILGEKYDSDSSLECLLPLKGGILCGKYDGACVWYPFDRKFGNEILVLTGADVDPIRDMSQDQEYVYTAARDGCIRKYSKRDMF